MRTKKQRIISFLMAFLLIFTFAFINPLTISKSYGALPVVALTANGVKIIMGTLASAGIGIVAGQSLQQVDFEKAAEGVANLVYRTLNGAEKLLLMSLSIVDNIVEVPISLYNSIVNSAKKVFETSEYSQTLLEQGITIKYTTLSSDNINDPNITLPIYQTTTKLSKSYVKTRERDMREAQPFLVYDGTQSEENTFNREECVTTNLFDFATEENPVVTATFSGYNESNLLFLTPSLTNYNISLPSYSKYKAKTMFLSFKSDDNINLYIAEPQNGAITYYKQLMIDIPYYASYLNYISLTSIKMFYYFIIDSQGKTGVHVDIYNGDEFVGQQEAYYGFFDSVVNSSTLFDTPNNLDTTINIENNPSTVIQNSTATDNVLTLPSTVDGTIGLTSSDVNVGSTDVPDTPNTEAMENINTNVGELVTGGTLGEQVNTNIGSVEGLHGEITEQVDFGAVFDTIAKYISALDISSVTWFPTAVASFLSPFLPLISLGLILFFIDRVLNGGA